MLGRGLTCMTSSRRPGFRSHSVFNTDVNESLSRVSRSRSTDNGLPARLGRGLFLEEGVKVWGSLALDIEGEVDISSSRSGEGEAFRFLEGAVAATTEVISIIR